MSHTGRTDVKLRCSLCNEVKRETQFPPAERLEEDRRCRVCMTKLIIERYSEEKT